MDKPELNLPLDNPPHTPRAEGIVWPGLPEADEESSTQQEKTDSVADVIARLGLQNHRKSPPTRGRRTSRKAGGIEKT